MSKSWENFFSCNLVTVMLFDGHKQIFSSYVLLLQSVVIFTVQLSVVVASLRASRQESEIVRLQSMGETIRVVSFSDIQPSSNILLSVALQPVCEGEGGVVA